MQRNGLDQINRAISKPAHHEQRAAEQDTADCRQQAISTKMNSTALSLCPSGNR